MAIGSIFGGAKKKRFSFVWAHVPIGLTASQVCTIIGGNTDSSLTFLTIDASCCIYIYIELYVCW